MDLHIRISEYGEGGFRPLAHSSSHTPTPLLLDYYHINIRAHASNSPQYAQISIHLDPHRSRMPRPIRSSGSCLWCGQRRRRSGTGGQGELRVPDGSLSSCVRSCATQYLKHHLSFSFGDSSPSRLFDMGILKVRVGGIDRLLLLDKMES